MKIRFDYDNDQIAFLHHNDNIEDSRNAIFKGITNIKQHEKVITELITIITDGFECIPITIEKQSDGEVTTLEEY